MYKDLGAKCRPTLSSHFPHVRHDTGIGNAEGQVATEDCSVEETHLVEVWPKISWQWGRPRHAAYHVAVNIQDARQQSQ